MTEEVPIQIQKWRRFAAAVEDHILNYVIPQYGDEGTEPAKEYDFDDCIKQSQRYLVRAKTNQRPEGLPRDMLKGGHWIQKGWSRLMDAADAQDVQDRHAALPIPEGVYYNEGNFYAIQTQTGMGNQFYKEWRYRADEFPNRTQAAQIRGDSK